MINALIERWRLKTHTFHFPVGEHTVTLEDVAIILGLPTNGLPVTGLNMSSFEAFEAECLHQFGVTSRKTNYERKVSLLFGTSLFGDKSGAAVHWKFLPLLHNFAGIIQFSWGSACLAHLYKSLCRATRVDCKEMDSPLTLLLIWAWICLLFLAPIFGNLRVFSIANR
ncbi:protein MAIN-LIKE 1-like [Arachis hypogaea]|uniref:protein MAIN-LIKE 1-like n=1 Tax=Arachis hypogaea TaxID=3818 RepID=UPI003B21F145